MMNYQLKISKLLFAVLIFLINGIVSELILPNQSPNVKNIGQQTNKLTQVQCCDSSKDLNTNSQLNGIGIMNGIIQLMGDQLVAQIDLKLRNETDLSQFYLSDATKQDSNGSIIYKLIYKDIIKHLAIIYKVSVDPNRKIKTNNKNVIASQSTLKLSESVLAQTTLSIDPAAIVVQSSERYAQYKLNNKPYYISLNKPQMQVDGINSPVLVSAVPAAPTVSVQTKKKQDSELVGTKVQNAKTNNATYYPLGSIGARILQPSQYLKDKVFLQIDAKIKNQNNLKGFNITEVIIQIKSGIVYTITYTNQIKTVFHFKANFLGGKITIQDITAQEKSNPSNPIIFDNHK